MVLFLTSTIGGIKKENGKKFPVRFSEQNQFLKHLKKHLKIKKKFVLIASDPTNYGQNDKFLQMDIEALKLSGFEFEEYVLLDNRNKEKASNILKNGNLIFLCGGNTFKQNLFFNDVCLGKYLKNIDSVIVGISAGSINSAGIAYNSPECEDDLINPSILKGLGITNINIEPHFELGIKNENKLKYKSIIEESYNRKIYALTDGAYILEDSNTVKIYGETYKIQNGNISIVCEDKESIEI